MWGRAADPSGTRVVVSSVVRERGSGRRSAVLSKRVPRRTWPPESDKALAFVVALTAEFTTVLSLPDLLKHVMRVLRDATGFDTCTVALLDDEWPGRLVIRAASGLRRTHQGLVLPAGKGLHGHVYKAATPLLVPDMHADPRVYRNEASIRSGIYAPLTVHGRTIGVLSAHRRKPDAFTRADLDLLTIVARHLAGAVEVANLHERVKTLASVDPLTGLANRRTFLDRLTVEITRLRRTGGILSVAFLDLDGFKAINDTYGHAAGDGMLVAAARHLVRHVRASDLVARVGGDEFTLLFPDTPGTRAEAVLERLGITSVAVPDGRGGELALRFGGGIAVWPEDGEDAETLLGRADTRLYATKRRT